MLILSIAIFFFASSQVGLYGEMQFEDEQEAWMPKDNPSILNKRFVAEVWKDVGDGVN
jgi:hypothetical protein